MHFDDDHEIEETSHKTEDIAWRLTQIRLQGLITDDVI